MFVHPDPPDQTTIIRGAITVGEATVAEWNFAHPHDTRPWKPTSIVGTIMPSTHQVEDLQIIVMRQDLEQTNCPLHSDQAHPPSMVGLTRMQALWRQQGWVAQDEMIHYMVQLSNQHAHQMDEPLCIPDEYKKRCETLGVWFGECIEKGIANGPPTTIYQVFWYQHHWFPVEVIIHEDRTEMYTTSDMQSKLQHWIDEAAGPGIQVRAQTVISAFPADCGFQTIAWLQSRMAGQETVKPIDPKEAIQMRQDFAKTIHEQAVPMPAELRLGGANSDNVKKQLQQLIEQHGVAPERTAKCAQQLMQAIGLPALQTALGSSRPWADLKTLATQCSPPIKIVLTSELQTAIANRIKSGQPFGRKEHKKHSKPSRPQVSIRAEQIRVPDGVFQADGHPISQIYSQHAQSNCRGLMIMNREEAQPYLDMGQALSQNAVAILVLDFQELQTTRAHEIIKFPAEYIETTEPILVTAAMFQLGMKKVTRWVAPQCPMIEEEEMTVIRAQVFRDQSNIWTCANVSSPLLCSGSGV